MRRLSPGRILAAVRDRLAGARYAVEDVLYVTGRFLRRLPGATAGGLATAWKRLGSRARLLLGTVVAGVAALIVFVGLAVPNLPCELPGGGACAPDDSAEELVPADALAYVHLDLDPESEQVADASRIVTSVPTITSEALGDLLELVPGSPIGPLDLALGAAPWFGGEAAVAVLPGGSDGTERVSLLAVDDGQGAEEFIAELTGERSASAEHGGVALWVGRDGIAAAQLDGFLVAGPEDAVRAVIEVATGAEGPGALADDEAAIAARGELPGGRFADIYISPPGAERLVAEAGGLLGFLSAFLSPDATRGVAISVGAADGELELAFRSLLEPDRSDAETGFFAAFSPFEAELPGTLGGDSLGYIGVGDPEPTVEALLAQAAAEAPGIAEGFEGLVGELRADGEIDVEDQLLPALGDEAAFAIEPREGEEGGAGAGPPFFTFLARGVDPDEARSALARLQGPIADAIEPEVGLLAPVFEPLEIDGVEAHSLPVSPAIDLTYAVVDDVAVIATDPLGVERVVTGDGALDADDLFERASDGFPDAGSLLAFLDLRALVLVAEQLGLAADPAYVAFAGEIRALTGFGLAVRLEDDTLATDARLIVEPGSAPPTPGSELSPGGGGAGELEQLPEAPEFEPPGLPEGLEDLEP